MTPIAIKGYYQAITGLSQIYRSEHDPDIVGITLRRLEESAATLAVLAGRQREVISLFPHLEEMMVGGYQALPEEAPASSVSAHSIARVRAVSALESMSIIEAQNVQTPDQFLLHMGRVAGRLHQLVDVDGLGFTVLSEDKSSFQSTEIIDGRYNLGDRNDLPTSLYIASQQGASCYRKNIAEQVAHGDLANYAVNRDMPESSVRQSILDVEIGNGAGTLAINNRREAAWDALDLSIVQQFAQSLSHVEVSFGELSSI